jgi:hypothetical protein
MKKSCATCTYTTYECCILRKLAEQNKSFYIGNIFIDYHEFYCNQYKEVRDETKH